MGKKIRNGLPIESRSEEGDVLHTDSPQLRPFSCHTERFWTQILRYKGIFQRRSDSWCGVGGKVVGLGKDLGKYEERWRDRYR